MARTVSPLNAQLESGGRTGVDLLAGFVLTVATGWVVEQAANNDVILDDKTAGVIVLAFWTIVTAFVKRRIWPILTDRSGAGRTDLPPVGPPEPIPDR